MWIIKPNVNKMARERNITKLLSVLGHKKYSESAERALAGIGTDAVIPLCNTIKDFSTLSSVKEKIISVLGKIGDAGSVLTICEVGCYYSDQSRTLVKEALINIGSQAVDILCKALDDYGLKENAAFLLGEIGDPRAIDPLFRKLEDWPKQEFRSKLTDAIGKIGGSKAIEILIGELEKGCYNYAAFALSEIGSEAVVPLCDYLRTGKSKEGLKNACFALGWICDSSSLEPIINFLRDKRIGHDCRTCEGITYALNALYHNGKLDAQEKKLIEKYDRYKFTDGLHEPGKFENGEFVEAVNISAVRFKLYKSYMEWSKNK